MKQSINDFKIKVCPGFRVLVQEMESNYTSYNIASINA